MQAQATVTLFSFERLSKRWDVSPATIRRQADHGRLKTIRIGRRRFVPLHEVERVEATGTDRDRCRVLAVNRR